MDTNAIRKQFDVIAQQYDKDRRYLIPCFDDFYTRSLSLLKDIIPNANKIADLGAGTGLLSMEIYRLYPDAQLILIDFSEKMISIAKQRFNGLSNFSFLIDNYINNLPDGCDIIASALSIHHLGNNEKLHLYKNIFNKLNKKGCFINLDQFCSESKTISLAYDKWWFRYIDNSDITNQAKSQWIMRKSFDREISIKQSVAMLQDIGFEHVECVYNFMKFGTIIAIK